MTKMSSEELQRLIAGYVLYDLSPEEAAIFEPLLTTNPAIAQEVERMQKALESVYASPEVQPPDYLRASILSAHQAIPYPPLKLRSPEASPFALPAPQTTRRRGWITGLGAVAATLIVGLSLSNYVLWRSLQALQAQQQTADFLTVSLEPTEDVISASATVTIDPDTLKATLRVENLPPLPEGQVYVLWTVLQPDAPFTTDDKNAILTEAFTVNEQDTLEQLEQFPLPPVYRNRQWVKAIAITVEAADTPQRHESSPILIEML